MSDKTGKQDAAAPSSSAAALLNQPIVLDTGTGTTRAGFAGGTKPKVRVCACVSFDGFDSGAAPDVWNQHIHNYALRTPTNSQLIIEFATKHT